MKRLLLISPWFGAWPEWINFFIESCKHNREIDWLIPTDQAEPENKASNVKFVHYSFDDYREKLSSEVGVDLHNLTPYKLCDLKPFLGLIFSAQLEATSLLGIATMILFLEIYGRYTLTIFLTGMKRFHRIRIEWPVICRFFEIRPKCRRSPNAFQIGVSA